jgi:aryl-alcohol dehydrogenase-like predicted oxidoreductase
VTELPLRRLGRTGLEVTELGLGGYQFTGEFGVARTNALEAITAALEGGVNLVDTAPMYGSGESEELVGRALELHPGVRISEKVGYFDRTIARHLGDAAYRDEAAIRRVVAHSLHLLRREFVDLLLIHEPEWPEWGLDPRTGDAPVTLALEALKREGLARAIGMGGQDAALMARLVDTGRFDVVVSVMHYDLAVQDARDQLLPAARRHDVGIILGTPLRQGLLARRHPEPERAMVADAERPATERADLARRLTGIYDLADEVGIPLPELALRYLLSDPQIGSVIPGARSASEVHANLAAAAAGPLPHDVIERIESVE